MVRAVFAGASVLTIVLASCGTSADLRASSGERSAPGTTVDAGTERRVRPRMRPDGTRDVRQHPFASSSPWNMALGSNATYVPAGLERSKSHGNYVEEEIIILEPDAPLVDVQVSLADWDQGADRCEVDGESGVIARVPIPPDFVTTSFIPGTPNHSAAVLMTDGRTLHQSQPFMRCKAGGPATSHYVYDKERVDSDLFGDGMLGAHGGSSLSALGGTIRLGELVPGGRIPHALKIVLDSRFLWYDSGDPTPGFRWPATKADGHASKFTYSGSVPDLEMGASLALPPSFDVASLQTEPARIMATALRDYGAYVVDVAGWDANDYATEWSPEGRVVDEFAARWGYPFVEPNTDTPWTNDHALMLEALHVVANNGSSAVGGGGKPRIPMAPPAT